MLRRVFLFLIVVLIPSAALADEAPSFQSRVHGDWHVTHFKASGQEIPVPDNIRLRLSFNQDRTWRMAMQMDAQGQTARDEQVEGNWSMKSNVMTLSVPGQQQSVDFTISFDEQGRLLLAFTQGDQTFSLVSQRNAPPAPKARPTPPDRRGHKSPPRD